MHIKIFLVFFVLIAVLLSSTLFLWHQNIYGTINRTFLSFLENNVRNANANFESRLNTAIKCAEQIAVNENTALSMKNYNTLRDDALYRVFNDYLHMTEDVFKGITIILPQGKTLSVGSPHYNTAHRAHSDYYEYVVAANGHVIFDYDIKDLSSAEPQIITAANSPDTYLALGIGVYIDGAPVGVIVFETNASLYASFGNKSFGQLLPTIVLNSNGRVIFCNDETILKDQLPQILEKISTYGMTGSLDKFELSGNEYYMIPIRSLETGWSVITLFNKSTITDSYHSARLQTILMAIITMIISFFIVYAIIRAMTKKLFLLSTYMQNFDLNDLESAKQQPHITSNDEVGICAKQYFNMIDTIEAQLGEMSLLQEQQFTLRQRMLEAQINPHFLYNSLDTIKNIALLQGSNNIANISSSLIALLKYSTNSITDYVSISEETDYIKSYIKIMQYQFVSNIQVAYNLDEEAAKCKTLKMILQPIVENCFKHGFIEDTVHSLLIESIICDSTVKIRIIDNGVGISKQKIDLLLSDTNSLYGKNGIGVNNVNARIKLAFGEEFGLSIYSLPYVQTIVEIAIPKII